MISGVIFLFLHSFLVGLAASASTGKPTAVIVVFYCSEGSGNWGLVDDLLVNTWSTRLQIRNDEPSWPVETTVEIVDFKSNFTYLQEWTVLRMTDNSLPQVNVFIFNTIGVQLMPWFAQFEVPCIMSSMNPNIFSQDVHQGDGFNYTFFIEPAPQYYSRQLLDVYLSVGVKTLVTITDIGDQVVNPGLDYSYSRAYCRDAAIELMVPKGIKLLESFEFDVQSVSIDDYIQIVEQTRKLNPDAVMICDAAVTLYPEFYDSWIVKIMRDLDYLPKALNIIDTYGTALATHYASSGLLNYITEAAFSHHKNKGIDYTEDSAPYSSEFAGTPPTVVAEAILAGSNLPGYTASSATSFAEWYLNQTGFYPSYFAVGVWGAYDAVEAALYWAATVNRHRPNNSITTDETYAFLARTRVSTPYGRIVFDYNRINTESYVSIMQYFDNSDDSELISPESQATHTFVYPMPTWQERTYSWSLMKGYVKQCFVIGAICTVIVLSIFITLAVNRNETDVKMLNYSHLAMMGLCAVTIIWSLVFVWQGDVTQRQCDALLWTVYLPASFVIMLVSMKAYRLSVFITSENKLRKRRLNHQRVLVLTALWTGFTAFMLLIAQLTDPLRREVVQTDIYRPSTDFYVCRSGRITEGILYFLVCEHVVFAFVCVFLVRNGSESFKDGLLMKESFIILFSSVFITFIFSFLGLSTHVLYFFRTSFVVFGVTGFVFRLLFSRCARHWMTQAMYEALKRSYEYYQSLLPETVVASNEEIEEMEKMYADLEEMCMNASSEFTYNMTDSLNKVFADEKRLKLFRELAKKQFMVENVDFIEALKRIPQQSQQTLIDTSYVLSKPLYDVLKHIYDDYCEIGSVNEVNISSKVRLKLKERLSSIPSNQPLFTPDVALAVSKEDLLGVQSMFNAASEEISDMLLLNIWTKFKTAETEIQMA